jgi:putative Mg2+ transporter-C (MgtC) family protein
MRLSVNDAGVRVGDPARLAAQVVSGIGFIGAGTIMQARGEVLGLTTAATIWVVAAIGLTIGSGSYLEAVGTTILVGIVLAGLGSFEYRLLRARRLMSGTIRAAPNTPYEEIETVLGTGGIRVRSKQIFDHPEDRTFELKMIGPARQYDVVQSALMRRGDVFSVIFI